jgi:hypothetical protein
VEEVVISLRREERELWGGCGGGECGGGDCGGVLVVVVVAVVVMVINGFNGCEVKIDISWFGGPVVVLIR